jgi:hypothetical protein
MATTIGSFGASETGTRGLTLSSAFHLFVSTEKLMRPRLADQPHGVPQIEAVLDKVLGQVVEQFRASGWVDGANVVERPDDAGPIK